MGSCRILRTGAGGDCSTCCRVWARNFPTRASKASALARHRSRDRRKSRTSVRNSLVRSCRAWYFAFQRSRLFSKNRASTRHGLRYPGASWSSLSERAIVCGSIRNKGLPPTMETAQQISPISQDQLPPKIGDFHHTTLTPLCTGGKQSVLRSWHFVAFARLGATTTPPGPPFARGGNKAC